MAYYGEPDGTSFGGDGGMAAAFAAAQEAAYAQQAKADALYGTGVGGDGSLAHLSEISNALNGGDGGAGGGGGSTIAYYDPSVDAGGGGPLAQAVAQSQAEAAQQQQQENAYTVGMANVSRAMSGNNGRGNVIDKDSHWDLVNYDEDMANLKAKQDEKGIGNWLANLFTNQVGTYDKDGNFTIGRQASLGKIATAAAGALFNVGVIPAAMMGGTVRSMFGQKDGKPNIQFEGYNTPNFWGNGAGDGDVADPDNPNISAADGGFDPNPPSNSELQLILDQMSGGGDGADDGADDGDSLMDSVVEATAEKQHRRLNTTKLEQMLNYGRSSAPEFRFFD